MTVMIPEEEVAGSNTTWYTGLVFKLGEQQLYFHELGPCHRYVLKMLSAVLCEQLYQCRCDLSSVEDLLREGKLRTAMEVNCFGSRHPLSDATYAEAVDLFKQAVRGDGIKKLLDDVFQPDVDGLAEVRKLMSA